jgi:hypothetical protein
MGPIAKIDRLAYDLIVARRHFKNLIVVCGRLFLGTQERVN